jgi:F420-dependent oxidoreductase-like protein
MSIEIGLMAEGQEGVSWEDWRALAVAVERSGFDGLYTSDHYLSEVPGARRGGLDAWGAVCGLAAVTERIRLGTLVSPATFRHPSVLAKLATTADHISGGRVDVGVGIGWYGAEHRAHGFAFPPARARMDRLEEQVEILCRSWADGEFSFAGAHYEVDRLDALPKPVQRPRPRLVVGGSGGPRGLALAARWADEYNMPAATEDEIVATRAALARAFEDAERDPDMARFSIIVDLPAGATAAAPSELANRILRLAELGVDRVILEPPLPVDVELIDLIDAEVLPAVRSA